MVHPALTALNFAALLALGIGFFWKDRRNHLVRAGGWIGLAFYWGSKAPDYFGAGDPVNGLGAAMAFPIFFFLAFHEWRSYKWDEEYQPLRFVTGATFIAGMGYFIIGQVPLVSKMLIDVVAHNSVVLTNAFGYNMQAGPAVLDPVDGSYYAPLIRENGTVWINIILDCTAIQAILVAAAFLFGCRGERSKRTKVFLIFLPVIYITNLIRNAIVIIAFEQNGLDGFYFAHNITGKVLSLGVLIVLILIAFIYVPGLYEDINGMFELPWRNKPGHDYMKKIGRLYDKDKDDKPEELAEEKEEM